MKTSQKTSEPTEFSAPDMTPRCWTAWRWFGQEDMSPKQSEEPDAFESIQTICLDKKNNIPKAAVWIKHSCTLISAEETSNKGIVLQGGGKNHHAANLLSYSDCAVPSPLSESIF